jgi:hypothetical protein
MDGSFYCEIEGFLGVPDLHLVSEKVGDLELGERYIGLPPTCTLLQLPHERAIGIVGHAPNINGQMLVRMTNAELILGKYISLGLHHLPELRQIDPGQVVLDEDVDVVVPEFMKGPAEMVMVDDVVAVAGLDHRHRMLPGIVLESLSGHVSVALHLVLYLQKADGDLGRLQVQNGNIQSGHMTHERGFSESFRKCRLQRYRQMLVWTAIGSIKQGRGAMDGNKPNQRPGVLDL